MRQQAMVWRNDIYHGSFICRCGADLLKLNATAYKDNTHVFCRRCGYVVAEIEEIEAPADQKPSPQHLVFSAALVEREST